MDIPEGWATVAGVIITGLVTWLGTKSTERGKDRELAKDSQTAFMQDVLDEVGRLRDENKQLRAEKDAAVAELRAEMDAIRDELRQLKAENHSLTRENEELRRVMARVAKCALPGCPCAARAAEFGGTP